MRYKDRTEKARASRPLLGALVLGAVLLVGAAPVGAATAEAPPADGAARATTYEQPPEQAEPGGTTTTDPAADPLGGDGTAPVPPTFHPIDEELVDAVVDANARLTFLDAAVEKALVAVAEATDTADDAQAELDAAEGDLSRADDRVERTTLQVAAIEDLLREAAIGEYLSEGTAEEEWAGQYLTGRTDDDVLRRALTRYVDRTTDELIADLERQGRALRRQRELAAQRRDDVAALRDAYGVARDRRREEAEALTALRTDVGDAADEAQAALDEALAARQAIIDQMVAAGIELVAGEGVTLDGVPLCEAGGIAVACTIATELAEMLTAASIDGVTLTGSGYRSTQQQIALRAANCGGDVYGRSSGSCSPPTARPGSSQHELGLAIDFHDCSARTTACYRWLAEHAAEHGFKNLASEPWHWSTTGS